jgi:hypothetical protein
MFTDFVLNGQVHGPLGSFLQGMGGGSMRFDTGLLRPYYDAQTGVQCVTVNTGRTKFDAKSQTYQPVFEQVPIRELIANGVQSPVFNATALRKDEWVQLDRQIIVAARQRLRAWADLAAANTFGGFNGMAKMVLEHETMSEPGEAVVDMDGLSEGRTDSPKFQLEGLPLPITHSGFYFSERRLAISRNTGTPLDSTMAEQAGRRVAETIEKTLIGTVTGITYGNASEYGRAPTVYGYTNFPDRLTKTNMTAPTGSNGPSVLTSWLQLRDLLYANNFYGPFMVYVSNDWDAYLDNLFSTTEPSAGTLRSRLLQVDGIQGIRRLDYLTDTFTVLMVQMTPDVARAVNGMDITTVQWESQGGMKKHFKVMAIQVPQLRADFNGNCGIAHGTTA